MQRYFVKEVITNEFEIVGEDYHHLLHVMRKKIGDQVLVVDGSKKTYYARLTAIAPEALTFQVVKAKDEDTELPVAVTLACGYPKGEKLEWIAQKATEMGMHRLLGFPASASVVKWDQNKLQKKAQRLGKIVKEASEQAHRTSIPQVELLRSFKELVARCSQFTKVLIAYEEAAKIGEESILSTTLRALQPGESLLVVFGPEGGLSPQEVLALTAAGALSCGLGPRILRTETAPLYLLGCCSYQWELKN